MEVVIERVLWVTYEAPDRNLGGGHVRAAHLLEALATRAEVELVLAGRLAPDHPMRDVLHRVTEVDVAPFRWPDATWPRRFLELAAVSPWLGPTDSFVNRSVRRRRAPVVAERADAAAVVLVDHAGLAPLLPRARSGRSPRWVLQLHHVPSMKAAQQRAITTGWRQRWLHGQERSRAARRERWAVEAYDGVVVVSRDDANLVAGGGRRSRPPVIVVPNGVDVEQYQPTPLPREPRILVTATLHYLPNVDGLSWFCREVLPTVRAEVADVGLDIVGRQPVPQVLALARLPGVAVHPDVPSVAPWFERARVAAVPLRIGTGTRIKALEAMAAGRPVVGTTVGLEGLGITDGHEALVADDPGAMAAAIVRLLRRDDDARRLAAAGRRHVERHHRWDRIASEFAQTLLTVGGRSGGL